MAKSSVEVNPFCSTLLHGTPYQSYVAYSLTGVNLFLAMTAFVGNVIILRALKTESSFHPPSKLLYRTLAFTDLFVGLLVQPGFVVHHVLRANEKWKLCHLTGVVGYFLGVILCGIYLSTLAAISVDRLLALSLGLRYRQVVTLGRARAFVVFICLYNTVIGFLPLWNTRVFFIVSYAMIVFCLVSSTFCYSKIYLKLRRMQAQVQDSLVHQPQPSGTTVMNIARYKKSVTTALWVHLIMLACYTPFTLVIMLGSNVIANPVILGIIRPLVITLVYFNSSLNPVLYCWRIKEVRQIVKNILKRFDCRATN